MIGCLHTLSALHQSSCIADDKWSLNKADYEKMAVGENHGTDTSAQAVFSTKL